MDSNKRYRVTLYVDNWDGFSALMGHVVTAAMVIDNASGQSVVGFDVRPNTSPPAATGPGYPPTDDDNHYHDATGPGVCSTTDTPCSNPNHYTSRHFDGYTPTIESGGQ